jgi:inhibitor of cysteine peptidase
VFDESTLYEQEQKEGNNMATLTLTAADNDESFQLNVGDEIVIHLKENPTTGFRWAIDQNDDSILALQSPNFAPSSSSPSGTPGSPTSAPGAPNVTTNGPSIRPGSSVPTPGRPVGRGGTRTFTFIGKNAGTVDLQLKLWREWEGDSSIRERFEVTIDIEG